MNVLVACEFSGVVREAFRQLDHFKELQMQWQNSGGCLATIDVN